MMIINHQKEELEKQNNRFEAALENMSHGLAMFDADQRLVVCNSKYSNLYGVSAEATAAGTTYAEIVTQISGAVGYPKRHVEKFTKERLDHVSSGRSFEKTIKLADDRLVLTVHRPMAKGGWVSIS